MRAPCRSGDAGPGPCGAHGRCCRHADRPEERSNRQLPAAHSTAATPPCHSLRCCATAVTRRAREGPGGPERGGRCRDRRSVHGARHVRKKKYLYRGTGNAPVESQPWTRTGDGTVGGAAVQRAWGLKTEGRGGWPKRPTRTDSDHGRLGWPPPNGLGWPTPERTRTERRYTPKQEADGGASAREIAACRPAPAAGRDGRRPARRRLRRR